MTSVGNGWKKVKGGQTKTWYQSLKSLTSSLRPCWEMQTT
ncbi:unnamed protein product [Schistosoma mattheei]|uniref:Uncharacterized protein n=1 Tax=Schistosoma mattheei TaxID=31246 RepID=A0A3P8A7S2_9TREM|nr:unnamed protein product [Schistosoma mattheei]